MRLHKYIANCGYSSRRHAELIIQAGRVKVNGRVVSSPGATVRPGKDTVSINDEPVEMPPPITVMFHKPAGLITSTHDTHERLTVMDYMPRSLRERGVVPAGRLDQDTEGLLILTNVGDLNHRITHPRYETEKEYIATVAERPAPAALERLAKGVVLDGERTAPARIGGVRKGPEGLDVSLVIREGRKRQVRRMFAVVGHEVLRLRRVRIGALRLGDLRPGSWRELAPHEIEALTASTVETGGRDDAEGRAPRGAEGRGGRSGDQRGRKEPPRKGKGARKASRRDQGRRSD